jgi:hypothetical protein
VPRILPGSPIARYLAGLDCKTNPQNTLSFLVFLDSLSICFDNYRIDRKRLRAEIEYTLKETTARLEHRADIDTIGFLKAVSETEDRLAVFNPWSWERNEAGSIDDFSASNWFGPLG